MRFNKRLATTALLVALSVLAPSVTGAQCEADRGRAPAWEPSLMRSLVIDVLSKGLQSGSRPLLRRALADTVKINGIAIEREAAIDAITAELAALRRSNHRFVLSHCSLGTNSAQEQVVLHSVPDTIAALHGSAEGAAIAAGGGTAQPAADVRAAEKSVLHRPDTGRGGSRLSSKAVESKGALPADSPVSQRCVFTLEDRTHQSEVRVTSVSFGGSSAER